MTISNPILNTDGEISQEIIRCLNTLYSTVEGTQPMDREFGLSIDCVDKPLPIAKNLYTLDVIEKTEKYEPRVEVSDVTFKVEHETLIPTIYLIPAEDEGEEGEDD